MKKDHHPDRNENGSDILTPGRTEQIRALSILQRAKASGVLIAPVERGLRELSGVGVRSEVRPVVGSPSWEAGRSVRNVGNHKNPDKKTRRR